MLVGSCAALFCGALMKLKNRGDTDRSGRKGIKKRKRAKLFVPVQARHGYLFISILRVIRSSEQALG